MEQRMRLFVLVLLMFGAFSASSSAQRTDPQPAASTTVQTSASASEDMPAAENVSGGGGGDAAAVVAAAAAAAAAATATAAEVANPLPDGWAEGSLPDGQVFYYHIEAPEDIQWDHPGNEAEISAAAETAAKAAAIALVTNEEKETLLAFRAAITDPDQVLRNWERSSHP
jgi:hypothetical protein